MLPISTATIILAHSILRYSDSAFNVVIQGHLPSVPFGMGLVKNMLHAVGTVFEEQLKEARTTTIAQQKSVDTAIVDSSTIPKALRTKWPQQALQVLQNVEELHAEMLEDDQQTRAVILAAEAGFVERMLQRQEKLESLEQGAHCLETASVVPIYLYWCP